MIDMFAVNATTVRNEWSAIVESVVREKPKFIKRTRDYLFLSDIAVIEGMLSAYSFHAVIVSEDDGSVTLALDEIDLLENAADLAVAVSQMAASILEYANDYYNDFTYWSRGDRKNHIPYVFKALIFNDAKKIEGLIECRRGGS
jgi:hypothetical protein